MTFFTVGQYIAIIVEKEKKLVLPFPVNNCKDDFLALFKHEIQRTDTYILGSEGITAASSMRM